MGRNDNIPEKYKNKSIFSISRLQTFLNCEHSYYLQYIIQLQQKQNIYSLMGEHVHSLIENLQKGKIDNAKAIYDFKNQLIETELMGFKFPSDKIKKNFSECIEHFLLSYKPIIAKSVKLEEEFYIEIGRHVLRGYIDLLVENFDNSVDIIDYKTSSKYKADDINEHALQLLLYAFAMELDGKQVNIIKWDMLKYVWCEYLKGNKTKKAFVQRNEIVKFIQDELLYELNNFGFSIEQTNNFIEYAIMSNSMSQIPEAIKDKFKISEGYVEYPYNVKTKEMLLNFIEKVIASIESKTLDENEWQHKNINKDSFFCSQLCGSANNCKHYQKFIRDNIDSFKKTDKPEDNYLKSLFG